MKQRFRLHALALVALFVAASASPADALEYRGWGLRAMVSEDPDQTGGGAHVDFGDFAPNVRFQPSAEVGFGDDVFTFIASGMVSYYFPVEAPVTPYAGGQLSVAFYSLDDDCEGFGKKFGEPGECDDTETEIGPMAVGGVETKLKGDTRFFAELQIGFGDLPDFRVVAGWTF